MKRSIFVLSMAVMLTSCMPGDRQVPQSPLLPLLERKSGLIAYVGPDWNIYTSDQAGRNLTAHTTDAVIPEGGAGPYRYYAYPAWSPDGNNLSFVGVSGEGTASSAEIYIADLDQDAPQKVYSSETEQPFYLYWSPDNVNLGFLSTTASGQSMILQSISTERQERTIIDIGAPYYWSWAPDGKTMIVHTGAADTSTPKHLSFLQVNSDIIEAGISEPPAAFQAPAWSSNGERILLTRVNANDENEIIVTNRHGEFEASVGTFNVNTAFAWSSDNVTMAYIDGARALGAGTIGTLHVMDLETSEDLFQDENVFAFFWSPSGEKLAYFIPMVTEAAPEEDQGDSTEQQQAQQLLLQLKILDVKSGESKELFTFRPSEQFSAILPYFDQYHQSATIWSPDDNNLVLSFLTNEGAPGIAIVAASGELEPRLLTQGYLAFWSPK
jgi:Tol biopolymer transport system component